MRKSQEIALSSRPYAFAALELLANLSVSEKAANREIPLILQKRAIKNTLYVLVASDKGLAGAFNSSLFKKFDKYILKQGEKAGLSKSFVAVGEKSANYLSKKGVKILKKFTHVGDYTTTEQVHPITEFLVTGYLDGSWDQVIVFSTNFRSALKQEPLSQRVLPIDLDSIAETVKNTVPEKGKFADLMKEQKINFMPERKDVQEYLIEPSPHNVLDSLVKHLFFMQIYHIILEANASEHAARRMAMKTASDNASELGDELNLQYNKARQSKITTELTEISAGAEAMQ